LKDLQDNEGFPLGIILGSRSRRWFQDEVEQWLENRSRGALPLKGAAKARRGRPRKQTESPDTANDPVAASGA
jgi:hypothetical protein